MPDLRVVIPAVVAVAVLMLIIAMLSFILSHAVVFIGVIAIGGVGTLLLRAYAAHRNRV